MAASAALALAELGRSEDVAALLERLTRARGELADEYAEALGDALRGIGGDDAQAGLRQLAATHPSPWIRDRAATALREDYDTAPPPVTAPAAPTRSSAARASIPVPQATSST